MASHPLSRRTKRHYLHLQRIADRILEIAALPDRMLTDRAAGVSGWSIAEQLEHVAAANSKIITRISRDLDAPPPDRANRTRLLGHLCLLTGWIPRGVGRAPKETIPRSGTADEVRARVAAAGEAVGALEERLPEIERAEWGFDHPYFGGLTPARWLRFMVVHTRHHVKIMADIEKALVQADRAAEGQSVA